MRLTLTFLAVLLCLAGQDPAGDVDKFLQHKFAKAEPGCAVGVVRNGKTLYAKGHGLADLEQSTPITPQSVFYLASVSKQSMAFAILTLEKQGKLSLDAPIGRYVDGLPAHTAALTLLQLLHHTSGVRDYLMLGSLAGLSADHVWTEAAFIRTLARQKALNFTPGSEHLYSNSGYVLLSLAAQHVTGQKLNDWMRTNVWTPLGMTTARWQHDHRDPISNRAHGYIPGWKISDSMLNTVGDGGMYASLDDMLQWARNFDDRKLGGDLLERMAQPAENTDGYGMGLAQGTFRMWTTISHGGGLGGYRTMLLRIPEKQFTVVTLCNNSSVNTKELAEEVAFNLLGREETVAVDGKAPPKPPAPPTPASATAVQRAAFTGEWFSPELDATYRISETDGKLMVQAGDAEPRELTAGAHDNQVRVPTAGLTLERQSPDTLLLNAGRVRGIAFRKQAPR